MGLISHLFLSFDSKAFYININEKTEKMKNDLMFGVKSLIAALLLVSCLTFFCLSFESSPFGVLMLSTCLLAISTSYIKILWQEASAK